MDQAEALWWVIAAMTAAIAGLCLIIYGQHCDLNAYRKFDRDNDGRPGGSLKRRGF